MLDNGRTDCDESHVTDVKIRETRELNIRLGKSWSTAAVDSGGNRAVERKASSQLGRPAEYSGLQEAARWIRSARGNTRGV